MIKSVSMQLSAVGVTENVKGDVRKFEIWYSGREVVYIVQVFDQVFIVFLVFFPLSSLAYPFHVGVLSCVCVSSVLSRPPQWRSKSPG